MLKKLWVLGLCVGLGAAPSGGVRGQTHTVRLMTAVPGCPICDLWLEYDDIVLQAQQEVAPLPHGVLYFYHSNDPAVIEPLIRFAHERTKLADLLAKDPELREQLGGACRHRAIAERMKLQISTSARGIFAILTTDDPTTFDWLRDKARMATRRRIPYWF